MALLLSLTLLSLVLLVSVIFLAPILLISGGKFLGRWLQHKSKERRSNIYARARAWDREYRKKKEKAANSEDEEDWETVGKNVSGESHDRPTDESWDGVVGFFHPFSNDGGGGERVLWAAVKAIQDSWPKAICVVYTGDHDTDRDTMISRVEDRFGIQLYPPTLVLLYLSTRHYLLSSTYPHFTLLAQSLGSLIVAYDAFNLLTPDIFIDSMGYAFAIALSKFLFPSVPTGAYVHYPTISTDMVDSLNEGGLGIHAGRGSGLKGLAKKKYWQMFANLYGWVGGNVDLVMVNSSWTQAHIRALWGLNRAKRGKKSDVEIVFPPVAVKELQKQIEVSANALRRERVILYIAQFRPEKNHIMILEAFAALLDSPTYKSHDAEETSLVFIGSVRHGDDATSVYKLRLMAHDLKIKDRVQFICNASWPQIQDWLRRSWVGVNGMWNEHFGIGVVEYQAAGLISVVHDSGGPKGDIVVDFAGGPTGFHATNPEEYALAFEKALTMSADEVLEMRLRARASAERFTEEAFISNWTRHMQKLIDMVSRPAADKR